LKKAKGKRQKAKIKGKIFETQVRPHSILFPFDFCLLPFAF